MPRVDAKSLTTSSYRPPGTRCECLRLAGCTRTTALSSADRIQVINLCAEIALMSVSEDPVIISSLMALPVSGA